MNYKNILVIVDLSPVSQTLVNKAVLVAKPYNSKIFLTQININYFEAYNGPIDVNISNVVEEKVVNNDKTLNEFKFKAKYSFISNLKCNNNSTQLIDIIKKYKIDLIITGYYQDFWSKLFFTTRQFINLLQIDTLVVPLSS